ncbi:MAG: hypothetical protein ACKO69_05250 [Limnohabitans sp.]
MKKTLWFCATVLLIANVLFAAWSNDWLQAWGWQPVQPREPQRLEQQLNPQALQIEATSPHQ